MFKLKGDDIAYENAEGRSALLRPDVDPSSVDYDLVTIDEDEKADLFTEEEAKAMTESEGESQDETLPADIAKSNSTATVHIVITLNNQLMKVYEIGKLVYTWPVSTGRKGKETPKGNWTPFLMDAKYFSRKFKVTLPWGIKYYGGYLIHASKGTMGVAKSNGCVRLPADRAKTLFGLVKKHGMRKTLVTVR